MEEEFIINNWEDTYISILLYNSNIGRNIETLIVTKNKKKQTIIDTSLLAITKPINDAIIQKYGIDALFKGIDEIVEYIGAEKYHKNYKQNFISLPIKSYINAKSKKIIQEQLIENNQLRLTRP